MKCFLLDSSLPKGVGEGAREARGFLHPTRVKGQARAKLPRYQSKKRFKMTRVYVHYLLYIVDKCWNCVEYVSKRLTAHMLLEVAD